KSTGSLSLYYQVGMRSIFFFFFQAEDGIRDKLVTGVQTCALPIYSWGKFPICEESSSIASCPPLLKPRSAPFIQVRGITLLVIPSEVAESLAVLSGIYRRHSHTSERCLDSARHDKRWTTWLSFCFSSPSG